MYIFHENVSILICGNLRTLLLRILESTLSNLENPLLKHIKWEDFLGNRHTYLWLLYFKYGRTKVDYDSNSGLNITLLFGMRSWKIVGGSSISAVLWENVKRKCPKSRARVIGSSATKIEAKNCVHHSRPSGGKQHHSSTFSIIFIQMFPLFLSIMWPMILMQSSRLKLNSRSATH